MSNTVQASYRVEVDAKKVNELLAALNDQEAKKGIKAGLRKSAGIIRKQAQKNLVAVAPGAAHSSTKGGVTYKPLKNEINIAVYRNASGARVDLLNKRRKGSRAFMLRIFEGGTKKRELTGKKKLTKKKGYPIGANRGVIEASYFFKQAVEAKKSEAEQSLERNILDSIKKVIAKKK